MTCFFIGLSDEECVLGLPTQVDLNSSAYRECDLTVSFRWTNGIYHSDSDWSSSWSRCRQPLRRSCLALVAATCWIARAFAARIRPLSTRLKAPILGFRPTQSGRPEKTTGSGSHRSLAETCCRLYLVQWNFSVGVSIRALTGACRYRPLASQRALLSDFFTDFFLFPESSDPDRDP